MTSLQVVFVVCAEDDVSLGSGDLIDAPVDGGKVVAGACGGDDVVVSVDADPSQGDRKQAGDSDNVSCWAGG